MAKRYKITISMTQETDGDTDNKTLVEEFSEDGTVHLMKTKVFTKHFTSAVAAATHELIDLAIGVSTPQKKSEEQFIR